MNVREVLISLVFSLFFVCKSFAQTKATVWLTSLDKSSLLKKQPIIYFFKTPSRTSLPIIQVRPDAQYQQIDGFGFALTGGSAQHMMHMSRDKRQALLQELFGTGENQIGISYLRLSIGASDLNDHVFSYDDLPAGETDPQLKKFNIGPDKLDVMPVLKEILAIQPGIKILASPWSAPLWMKTNQNIQGGKLSTAYYAVYARYIVKYIQSMKANGISIDAVTVQNEPLNNGNTPSMQMFAKEQARFIRDYLGPAFNANQINTKVILYDHNCDAPEYPIAILTDPVARKYINGSGFHLYAGPITALSKVHNAFPDKQVYFTEMMAVNRNEFNVAAPESRIVIGATRNWSRNVILWNLAANSANQPHTDNGGCGMCQGAVTIDGDSVQRNIAYYTIAHVSKFVPLNSVRIHSNEIDSISNVAFKTPQGKLVVIAANNSRATQEFIISYKNKIINYTLNRGDVATFLW